MRMFPDWRGARSRSRRDALVAALLAACAVGDVGAAELIVDEPLACVTLDELSFRVERALDRSLEAAAPLTLRVSASLESDGAGPAAQLVISEPGLSTPSGARRFRAATCEQLLDRLALGIALALGARSDTTSTESFAPATSSEPAVVTVDEAVAPPANVMTDAPAVADEPSPGPRLGVRGALVADTGTLPRAALGVALGAGLTWPAAELRLIGTFLPERESRVDANDPSSPGAEMGLLAGSVSGCVPVGAGAGGVALQLCAGWEVGQLSGHGTRVDDPHRTRALWSAPRIDVAASWSVPSQPLALELLVSAAAPLTRDEFILKDIESIHRPASVVGRATLGLRWDLE